MYLRKKYCRVPLDTSTREAVLFRTMLLTCCCLGYGSHAVAAIDCNPLTVSISGLTPQTVTHIFIKVDNTTTTDGTFAADQDGRIIVTTSLLDAHSLPHLNQFVVAPTATRPIDFAKTIKTLIAKITANIPAAARPSNCVEHIDVVMPRTVTTTPSH